jgi:hypothetical protein
VPGGDARRFTGKERDAETGLDYFSARYYAQALPERRSGAGHRRGAHRPAAVESVCVCAEQSRHLSGPRRPYSLAPAAAGIADGAACALEPGGASARPRGRARVRSRIRCQSPPLRAIPIHPNHGVQRRQAPAADTTMVGNRREGPQTGVSRAHSPDCTPSGASGNGRKRNGSTWRGDNHERAYLPPGRYLLCR